MTPSYISATQWKKIFKAAAYAFASGFVATLALTSADFIQAAQQGTASIANLAIALVVAACVGGVNGVAVMVVKLFKDPTKES